MQKFKSCLCWSAIEIALFFLFFRYVSGTIGSLHFFVYCTNVFKKENDTKTSRSQFETCFIVIFFLPSINEFIGDNRCFNDCEHHVEIPKDLVNWFKYSQCVGIIWGISVVNTSINISLLFFWKGEVLVRENERCLLGGLNSKFRVFRTRSIAFSLWIEWARQIGQPCV